MGQAAKPSPAHHQPTGLVYDAEYLRHVPGPGHPESPERLTAIVDGLRREGLLGKLVPIAPPRAPMEWISLVHDRQYIQAARRDIQAGRAELSTGDTEVCRESFSVALRAAGGAVAAVQAVLAGKVRNAFCAVRPPGHHAGPGYGMGFCIFNNAAIAARHAQRFGGVGRVLIVDWDLHHGNGTQEVFYEDPTVFSFSTHEDGQYPMDAVGSGFAEQTGQGAGAGTNLNVPLPPGSGDEEILAAFTEKLAPAAKEFGPELAIISAGFDSRAGDPLGSLRVSDEGFARLTRLVMGLVPGGRVVSVLEGGYNLAGLASAAAAHVRALMEGPQP